MEIDTAGTTMNYFRLTLLPYLQFYFDFNSVLDIARLYYNDFNLEFTKAKVELAFYLTFNGKGEICPGFGWNHDAYDLKATMVSHFA